MKSDQTSRPRRAARIKDLSLVVTGRAQISKLNDEIFRGVQRDNEQLCDIWR